MMAQGDFGGDGSVAWRIDVDQLRNKSGHSHGSGGGAGHGKGRHHQDGIDEVDANQYFTISIEVPSSMNDKNAFATALQAAAQTVSSAPAGSGARVSLPLPIEPGNPDQIQIKWNSTSNPPAARSSGTYTRASGAQAKKKKR